MPHTLVRVSPDELVDLIQARTSDLSRMDEDEALPDEAVVQTAQYFIMGVYALLNSQPPAA